MKRWHIIACLLLAATAWSGSAQAQITVAIPRFSGDIRYPLVFEGFRQVLQSNLEDSAQFTLDQSPEIENMALSDLFGPSSDLPTGVSKVDVILFGRVSSSLQGFTINLQAYDPSRGYNMGSQRIEGSYKDARGTQRGLFEASMHLLGVVPDAGLRKEVQKSHTKNADALASLGQAVHAKKNADLVGFVEKTRSAIDKDPGFDAARRVLQKNRQMLFSRVRTPMDKARLDQAFDQHDAASRKYEQLIRSNPNDPKLLAALADSYLKQGKRDEALKLLKRAKVFAPENAQVSESLASALLANDQKDAAIREYQSATRYGSSNPKTYMRLGRLYQQQGKYSAAHNNFKEAATWYAKQNSIDLASDAFLRSQRLKISSRSLLRNVDLLVTTGRLKDALDLLEAATLQEPTNPHLHTKLGEIMMAHGEHGKAAKHFRSALVLDPKNIEAHLNLGIIYARNRLTYNDAIKHLQFVLTRKPDESRAALSLAQLYTKQGQHEKARNVLLRISKSHPKNISILIALGHSNLQLGALNDAEEALLQAIQYDPINLEAHELLTLTHIQRKDRDETLRLLGKVYQINPEDNRFIRSGGSELATFVPAELLGLVSVLPKTLQNERTIRQVFVKRVSPNFDPLAFAKKLVMPGRVNVSLLERDLKLALYSRFQPVAKKQTSGFPFQSISYNDFHDANLWQEALKASKIQALLGYSLYSWTSGKDGESIQLDVEMVPLGEESALGIQDKASLPVLTYRKEDIIVFNELCLIGYSLIFLLLISPLLYKFVVIPIVRGTGTLEVEIEYDPKFESFLTLKLTTKIEKEKDQNLVIVRDKRKHEKRKFRQHLKQKGQFVKEMAGEFTVFKKVPAREYYCYLYGTTQDPGMKNVTIGSYHMYQKTVIRRKETSKLTFKLKKEEAFITVYVMKGEAHVTGASIHVEGTADVIYTRGESGAFLYLKPGKYKLIIEYEDKKIQHVLELQELNDQQIFVDLETAEDYKEKKITKKEAKKVAKRFEQEGKHEDASKMYAKAGDAKSSDIALAEKYLEQGKTLKAAKLYAGAKDFLKAAELYRSAGKTRHENNMLGFYSLKQEDQKAALDYFHKAENHSALSKVYEMVGNEEEAMYHQALIHKKNGELLEAAQAFEKAKHFSAAAEIFETTGDAIKAASLYAKDQNFQLSAELYARSGEMEKAAMAYEKAGYYSEAGQIYSELGQTEKVFEMYMAQEHYVDAAKMRLEEGAIDDAIEICNRVPEQHHQFDMAQSLLAELFAKKGITKLAVDKLLELFGRDPESLEPAQLYQLGGMLEEKGDLDQSLEVFDALLKRDYQYEDVAMRVEDLQKKIDDQKVLTETIASGAPVARETRYEKLDELGRGAMGIVYKARDKSLDRIVAYKTLPHTLKSDPEALETLKKEAQTAGRLNHPGIVTIFDVGEENGDYFMAMEYVEGRTLQDVLKKVKRINAQGFFDLAIPLASVIGYAHEQKVVHRDIKPSNILLTSKKEIKLMDFGLAKVLEDISIDKTMLRGTPLYMAPEQIIGEDIDFRCDLYAMGIIFYEMIVGHPPFFKGDVMYAHLHEEPTPIKEINPKFPDFLNKVIMSCLEKDKNKRPPSAKHLEAALLKFKAAQKPATPPTANA